MNDIEANKTTFKKLISDNIHRDGIDDLMNWLETTDFYTAPSSVKYHGAEPGGLCAHSLGVYECLKVVQEDETDETIALVALFHDICKVDFYKVSMRNVKDESGKWTQMPFYEIDERSIPLGHGEKSMAILMKYMSLTDEEMCAIRWHMGFSVTEPLFEKPSMVRAMSKYRLVLKLQNADSQCAFWFNQ